MAVLRTDIERALDQLKSQQDGMRFQTLAVALGKKRWPELVAHPRSGMKSRVQRARLHLRTALDECCQIALDRRGGIISYESRTDQCGTCTGPSETPESESSPTKS